jgi:hypothetical protein
MGTAGSLPIDSNGPLYNMHEAEKKAGIFKLFMDSPTILQNYVNDMANAAAKKIKPELYTDNLNPYSSSSSLVTKSPGRPPLQRTPSTKYYEDPYDSDDSVPNDPLGDPLDA